MTKYIVIGNNIKDNLHGKKSVVRVQEIDGTSTNPCAKIFYSNEILRIGDVVVQTDDVMLDMCKKIRYDDAAQPATVLGTWSHNNGKTIYAFSAAFGDIKIELQPSSPYLYTEAGHEILVGYNFTNKMTYIKANLTAEEARRQVIKKFQRGSK